MLHPKRYHYTQGLVCSFCYHLSKMLERMAFTVNNNYVFEFKHESLLMALIFHVVNRKILLLTRNRDLLSSVLKISTCMLEMFSYSWNVPEIYFLLLFL